MRCLCGTSRAGGPEEAGRRSPTTEGEHLLIEVEWSECDKCYGELGERILSSATTLGLTCNSASQPWSCSIAPWVHLAHLAHLVHLVHLAHLVQLVQQSSIKYCSHPAVLQLKVGGVCVVLIVPISPGPPLEAPFTAGGFTACSQLEPRLRELL